MEGEALREVLCALGNGRFATRGAAPEASADDVHYPATYAAGVFNRLTDEIEGHLIENESMVNLPNWQLLRFRIDDGDWVDLADVSVSHYVQELDLRRGVLTRRFRFEDRAGRQTVVAQRRLVSMADPFVACIDSTFVAINWDGQLVVRSGIDGRVSNVGIARYRGFSGKHVRIVATEQVSEDLIALDCETTQSQIRISTAARQRVLVDDLPVKVAREFIDEGGLVAQDLVLDVREGEAHTVDY
jgi:trehalose/maltose hydrolase-like predicted phosphorylase